MDSETYYGIITLIMIFETFAFSVGNARLSVPDVTTHM